MSRYRQAILVFGLVLPGLLGLAIVGAMLFARGKVHATLAEKTSHYATFDQSRKAAMAMETRLAAQRPHLEAWEALLAEETASSLTAKLSDLRGRLPAAEFQQTSFNRGTSKGAFGAVSAQPSSELQLSFRGSFRSLQAAFLEIETRLPQLQLQTLKIEPASGDPTLNAQLTYTAWEK